MFVSIRFRIQDGRRFGAVLCQGGTDGRYTQEEDRFEDGCGTRQGIGAEGTQTQKKGHADTALEKSGFRQTLQNRLHRHGRSGRGGGTGDGACPLPALVQRSACRRGASAGTVAAIQLRSRQHHLGRPVLQRQRHERGRNPSFPGIQGRGHRLDAVRHADAEGRRSVRQVPGGGEGKRSRDHREIGACLQGESEGAAYRNCRRNSILSPPPIRAISSSNRPWD